MIDGNYSISESPAIQAYIIRKAGLDEFLGKDAKDKARVTQFLAVFTEIHTPCRMLFFDK